MNMKLTTTESQLLVSCSKSIICYDLNTWKINKHFAAHKSEIYCLSIYPGTNVFITGSMDKSLKFWSIEDDCVCIKTIEGHSDSIRCIKISLDGGLLFTGGYDNTVKVWNLSNKICLGTLEGHQACITDLAYNDQTEVLFSSSKDGSIKAWNIKGEKCIATYKEDQSDNPSVYSILLMVKSQLIVSSLKHPEIKVWDISTAQIKGKLIAHTTKSRSL